MKNHLKALRKKILKKRKTLNKILVLDFDFNKLV